MLDSTSGVVGHLRFRMDAPHCGALAAETRPDAHAAGTGGATVRISRTGRTAACARSIGPRCLSAGRFTRSRPLSARESTAKMRNRTDLSGADRAMLEELIADLEDALGTPRNGPW